MRIAVLLLLIFSSNFVYAELCENALHKFIRILADKGDLDEGKNIYPEKVIESDFNGKCEVKYQSKDFILLLHSDDVTIVVSSLDTDSKTTTYQGPFLSAHRK